MDVSSDQCNSHRHFNNSSYPSLRYRERESGIPVALKHNFTLQKEKIQSHQPHIRRPLQSGPTCASTLSHVLKTLESVLENWLTWLGVTMFKYAIFLRVKCIYLKYIFLKKKQVCCFPSLPLQTAFSVSTGNDVPHICF